MTRYEGRKLLDQAWLEVKLEILLNITKYFLFKYAGWATGRLPFLGGYEWLPTGGMNISKIFPKYSNGRRVLATWTPQFTMECAGVRPPPTSDQL